MKAIFRAGAFVPEAECNLPEGAEVRLTIEGPTVAPPEVTEPEQKMRILDQLIRRMQGNPIPEESSKFTRDQLQERC
jgi:hypothetical protein